MIEISRMNRINSRTISNEIQAVDKKYQAIANAENKDLRTQRDDLWKEEADFRNKASDFIKTLSRGDLVHVQTQVGPDGGIIIHDYPDAVIETVDVIATKVNTFNISDPSAHEGRPFTIGLSCLLSIKLR